MVPVITDDDQGDIQGIIWGLIPSWCKDTLRAIKLSNQCLNARGETIFSKPAYKGAAMKRRCLITCIDGFFENCHLDKKKIPFFIKLKNDEPMTMDGLWERWENREEGIVRNTYTIITTNANSLMAKIHNNPNREEGDE